MRIVEISQIVTSELSWLLLEEVLLHWDLDLFKVIDSVQSLLIDSSFPGDFLKGMEQKLCLIGLSDSIFIKFLAQLSRDRQFLGLQERFKHHVDGEIDIVSSDVVSQVDLSSCFRHSDDGLNVSYCYWDASNHRGLFSDVSVELSDLVLIDFI